MARKASSTHRIGEMALGALKQIGLSATPQNYELWYEHVEGRTPDLSRDIQSALDENGKINQSTVDKLYKDYIQHADLSKNVIDLMTRFESEVTDLYDVIEKTGENTIDHNEKLTDLSGQLRQSTEEFPAVGALLEGVMSVAQNMRAQNEQLESRLAESTSEINSLRVSVENIQAEAMKDALTGVANRAKFDQFLEEHMAAAKEEGQELALVISDIDHFKSFNDKWGHTTGDQVLRLVAEVMNSNVKGKDLLARYGGEEFAIVLPDTSVENAQLLANKIRQAVESRRLKKRRTDESLGTVTMSMGIAGFTDEDSAEGFIERADACLYAAKNAGRNRVFTEADTQANAQENSDEEKQAGAA